MISNRTLAIAAVLALAIPAMGAAAPVYANPVTEQLVEGHTVFAVLEVVEKQTDKTVEFAAAVAVLVRENVQVKVANRFPGVLWFNDQYLVNPYNNTRDSQDARYPCGGAVLAVNENDPDPRVSIGPNAPPPADGLGQPVPGDDPLSNGPYGNDFAWLNAQGTPPYSDALTGVRTGLPNGNFGYRESYIITDPNDHMWQIDVYDHYTRLALPGTVDSTIYTSTVWAVNILGSPVFTPDDGAANCSPYMDLLDLGIVAGDRDVLHNYTEARRAVFGDCDDQGCLPPEGHPGSPDGVTTGAYQDNPRGGYSEPSTNSGAFCYNGNDATNGCPNGPVRLYNALLYFKLRDLNVNGGPRDHSNSGDTTQTNGCQTGTEWACPAGGANDDDNEGFSHPFHPGASATNQAEACPSYFAGSNPSNHGGSTTAQDGVTFQGAGGECDYLHATKNIDLYFSGAGRPFPPVVPNYTITDFQGSSAPFHYEAGHP